MIKYPKMSISFPGRLPDEQIIKVVHRDIFILFKRVVFFAVLLLPLIGAYSMALLLAPDIGESAAFPAILVGAFAYGLFCWLIFFFNLLDYILDVWVVTSERVFNVKQDGFFARSVIEIDLANIQDMASEVKGVWPTVMSYGTLHIQTASERDRFKFEEVDHPDELRALISGLIKSKNLKKQTDVAA
jgi:hypothetical protein